jgi:hypothetical protein
MATLSSRSILQESNQASAIFRIAQAGIFVQ